MARTVKGTSPRESITTSSCLSFTIGDILLYKHAHTQTESSRRLRQFRPNTCSMCPLGESRIALTDMVYQVAESIRITTRSERIILIP